MRAERAVALVQSLHDRGDRNHRRVAGENGVGPHVALDLGKQLLLERQIFRHRLDDVIGVAHRVGEIGAWRARASTARSSSPRSRRLAAMRDLRRIEILRDRVGDRHVVTGEREHLRNAVAHQPGADNGDARFCHRQPAV